MSRVEILPRVTEDLDRILDHLHKNEAAHVLARVDAIVAALAVLEQNPLIGRSKRGGLRELVIGRRIHGFLALYRYVPETDTVFVLAIRAQREAGYRHD